ncbi:MAG: homocysteine methyltransferase [Ruminococcaceae bacterium]|nr:homocysteine methyltransferase [Oscillospiraceae bacterium]
MNIKEYLKNNFIYLDGGMGTLLQKEGLLPGEMPERWNITHPEVITKIHRDYFDAGSNVVNTNTFGANILKFAPYELEEIVKAAIENAKKAKEESASSQPKWIALDIGPSGRMLAPYGDFQFEDAVKTFAETVKLGVKYGADLVVIETMNDSYETKAALLAVKENCDLPVFVSNAYGEDGKLMTGASPSAMVAMLEGMGADAIGINCSLGPRALMKVCEEYLSKASVPVILKPNAGLPKAVDGETIYDVLPDEFSEDVASLMEKGVRIAGGCCGTTPEYISALVNKASTLTPKEIEKKNITCVSSYTHTVEFNDVPILIGERINPTGKKRFKEALKNNDIDYILNEGISQQEKGVHILDVNVGLPEIDEATMLKKAVFELQAIINLPLQIDTSDADAMEKALRIYNGKAMINSVNGKKESMDAVFPLVKKYGGLVVALTLDENGIPATAEGRFKIAEKILSEASKYGIDKKDIIFDPLTLTVSAEPEAAKETLEAVNMIKNKLGVHTSLGVSNVSFGLPHRDAINSTFFSLAMNNGLSAAIMNPYSAEMMKAYYSYCALSGLDENFSDYISFAETLTEVTTTSTTVKKTEELQGSSLQKAITKGLKEQAALITKEMLTETPPLSIVQEEIIPALNIVGIGFENKTVYLPQLLMSAEAAKSAFEVIKENMSSDNASNKCNIVIATVKGDIHDIGKNIVKLLLENYGFKVTDLGKDVPPEEIVKTSKELCAPIVGLSALMTTTVPAMEETIKLLRKECPHCKVVVGGAVLTQEYADSIGADKYAKDAMETVRYAEEIDKKGI